MEIEEKKLANFESLVISDAIKMRDEVLEQLKAEKEQKLSDVKTELTEKYNKKFSREADRIIKDKNQRIADKQSNYKKDMLAQREILINGIFGNVIAKLSEYTKSDEYITVLKKEIENNISGLSDNFVIVVNENDKLAQSLGYNFELTTENFYGGCKIIDKKNNVQVDLTNKSKLEKERSAFLETYNLKI